MIAMVYCTGCGKQIDATAATCPLCGAPQAAVVPIRTTPKAQANRGFPWVWIGFLLFALIAVALAALVAVPAYKQYREKAAAMVPTQSAAPIRVSGIYEFRTDPETEGVLGRQICFEPDESSKKLLRGNGWFCFDDLNAAAKMLQLDIQPTSANCGLEGMSIVDISNYVPFLVDSSDAGNDMATLLSVVTKSSPRPIACPKVEPVLEETPPTVVEEKTEPTHSSGESEMAQAQARQSGECAVLQRQWEAADRDARLGNVLRLQDRARVEVAQQLTGCGRTSARTQPTQTQGICSGQAYRNPPIYPAEEQRRGIQGTTTLVVSVDEQGGVTDVAVEEGSGNRNLDREAVKAATRWCFKPEVRAGKPAPSRVRVPVEFKDETVSDALNLTSGRSVSPLGAPGVSTAQQLTQQCIANSRTLTTEAGSRVALSESEAIRYCNCAQQQSGTLAGGIPATVGNRCLNQL